MMTVVPFPIAHVTVYVRAASCAGRQALPLLETFFERWPTAEAARDADETDLMELLRPLGLAERRSQCIVRFSGEVYRYGIPSRQSFTAFLTIVCVSHYTLGTGQRSYSVCAYVRTRS